MKHMYSWTFGRKNGIMEVIKDREVDYGISHKRSTTDNDA